MFSKKLATADYSSGSFFTLCCGFIGKNRRSSDTIGGGDAPKPVASSSDSESETETKPAENGSVKSVPEKSVAGDEEQSYADITEEKKQEKETEEGKEKKETEEEKEKKETVEKKEEQEKKETEKGKEKKETEKGKEEKETQKGKESKVDEAVGDAKDSDVTSVVEQGDATSRHSFNAEVTEEEPLASPKRDTSHSTERSAGAASANLTFENQAFMADGGSLRESDRAQSADRLTNDEHLFDVSDLQQEPALISKCGSLEVSFQYDSTNNRIIVHIHQAREIPAKDRGGANNTQVRVMLLPGKKQKHKTKVKAGDSPVFDEKIYFNKVMRDEVAGMGIRFRLYGLERMRRERMIGESIVGFASLNLDQVSTHWVVLEPRSNLSHGDSGFDVSSLSRSDSGSSNQSLQHGGMPELLMGLAYNGTTGRLSVEIIKGSNFRNMAMNRAPDTYVKLSLMNSSGQEVQHCKTSIRRGQPNPLFKETFMLQVALFQLPDVTLMVSVYNKKSMKKKEMIGWFSLGANSSGEEEGSHWLDMRENKGEQVCRWHVLLES